MSSAILASYNVEHKGIKAMLSQVTTKSYNVFLKDGAIVSAKCRTTGRFVKRALAQVELNAELKAHAALETRISFIEDVKQRHAAFTKARLNMKATDNINAAMNKSLVEKAKLQLQASVAKVAMLGMITLSAFNFV